MSIQTVKGREAWERFAVYQGMITLLMLLILEGWGGRERYWGKVLF